MQSGGRKRVVSSCIPCYTKKQKCDRRYPCNHCTRRRRPEECIYNPSPASQALQAEPRPQQDLPADHDGTSQDASCNIEPVSTSSDSRTRNSSRLVRESGSLAELFGHVEHGGSNTMALVRRLGLAEDESWNGKRDIPSADSDEIEEHIRRLPNREIFDFLVRFYVTEVHWMEQVVYVPWFLGTYQKWWTLGRLSLVFDVEFAVLFLRVCSYATQFLPSPSYTIDSIRGMPLTDVRDACLEIADNLAAICVRLDARGSLVRVQHLSVLGLERQCEGRINAFREVLSTAVGVGQRIGLHQGRAAWTHGMHELDEEIRCRVFCNLYIWDSLVSRQLDCAPLLPASLTSEHLPQMHLSPDVDDADGPGGYWERVMQAHLATFWKAFAPSQGPEYEPTVADASYEKFCSEYLTRLPPAMALEPSNDWDERLQRLPLQRQILHVAIFESLRYNFRPVLLRERAQVQDLPVYKQVLIASQRRALAVAALKVLAGVSKLHAMLGGSYTRLATIIVPTFEAAVVLVSLTIDEHFPDTNPGETRPPHTLDVDPLGEGMAHLTRDRCVQALQEALARLRMLAEVSSMARTVASALNRLMAKLPSSHTAQGASFGSNDFFAPALN